MKLLLKLLFIFFVIGLSQVNAQNDISDRDTMRSHVLINKSILPLSLIGLGLVYNNSDFEKRFSRDVRKRVGQNYNNSIDNYLQYVPLVQMYAADMMGIRAKNHWFDQTKYMLISNIFTGVVTSGLKWTFQKTRPNGSNYSFPSGHTSTAFTEATVLYLEYKDSSPYLAYSGYAFAVATGALRIMNNRHYISDVLSGAGIGILMTNLVYHFEPFKAFNPFNKGKNITIIPQIKGGDVGVYFSYAL